MVWLISKWIYITWNPCLAPEVILPFWIDDDGSKPPMIVKDTSYLSSTYYLRFHFTPQVFLLLRIYQVNTVCQIGFLENLGCKGKFL